MHLTNTKTARKTKHIFTKWKAPRGYKLNTDDSTSQETSTSGLGGIIRDKAGNWILGFIGNSSHADNIRAEIQTLVIGLKLALEHNLTPLEICVDCQVIRIFFSFCILLFKFLGSATISNDLYRTLLLWSILSLFSSCDKKNVPQFHVFHSISYKNDGI